MANYCLYYYNILLVDSLNTNGIDYVINPLLFYSVIGIFNKECFKYGLAPLDRYFKLYDSAPGFTFVNAD